MRKSKLPKIDSIQELATAGASSNEIIVQMHRVRDYLRNASDPNEVDSDGRTLLLMAVCLCFEGEGESLVANLLERGADPNRPSPWVNFTMLLTMSNSLPLVRKFVDGGMRLNDVYDPSADKSAITKAPSTLLDHVCAIRDYISPKRKKLNALSEKHAGGLGKRRRFIDETIALLESHGAKRAGELSRT